jgi:hypothetical protein
MTEVYNAESRMGRRRARYRKAGELDLRTRGGRRAKELIAEFTAALGGQLTPAQALAVFRAATLVALAESARARGLAGDKICMDDIVRLDHSAERAVRQLGIGLVQSRRSEPLDEILDGAA